MPLWAMLHLPFHWGNIGGLSLGITPFSSINYDVTETIDNELLGSQQDYRFLGDGQTHQFYLGGGFKAKMGKTIVSIGANGAFLFGTLSKEVRVNFPELTNSIITRRTESLNFRGFTWNTGLQITHPLKDKSSYLTIGVQCSPQNSKPHRTRHCMG